MIDGPYKLPEGWRWVRLGQLARIYAGSPAPQDPCYFEDGHWPFVRVSDLSATDNDYVMHTRDYLNDKAKSLHLKKASKGTIIFPKSGAAILTNNRAILGIDAFIVSHLAAVDVDENVADKMWVFRWLQTVDMKQHIENPSYPSLRLTKIKQLALPVPPIHEQQRIVARIEALMERIREARRLRQEAREDTERLWQAVLADTFPHPGTDLPHNWRWVRLGEVCNYQNGVWGAQDPKGYPVLRSKNFTNEGFLTFEEVVHIKLTERQVNKGRLHRGDILLERSGGGPNKPVGRVCIFTETPTDEIYCFGNFITVLRPLFVNLDVWFIFNYLHWVYISGMTEQLQTQTTNIRNLRFKEYMDIFIPLPPLEEQRRIVAYLETTHEKIISLINSQAQFETELQRLEQSILDSAFKGEL